jgi:hypothetical protein
MESPSRDGKVESEADARRVFDERIRWQVKQFPKSALEGVEVSSALEVARVRPGGWNCQK